MRIIETVLTPVGVANVPEDEFERERQACE